MSNGTVDVFGLGQCCLDYLASADQFPAPDAKCEVSRITVQGGGPVATALAALSRWGLRCAFTGVLGDDSFGMEILTALQAESVHTDGVLVRKGSASQFAFIVTESGVGRRTIFWRRPTGRPPTPREINHDLLKTAKTLHLDGLFVEASLAACKTAQKAGIPVVVDAGSLREGMLEIARLSDYFIAAEPFAKALVGGDDPPAACRRLSELGPRLTAVTLGSRGCVARYRGEMIQQPAYPVAVVDTTGCGDIFHAGFIYGLIHQWSVRKSLDFSAWAAARASLKVGGRAGIPKVEEFRVAEKMFCPEWLRI